MTKIQQAFDELRQIANVLEPTIPILGKQLRDLGLVLASEVDSLQEDSDFLSALEDAGVDNWDGYSIAYRASHGDIDD